MVRPRPVAAPTVSPRCRLADAAALEPHRPALARYARRLLDPAVRRRVDLSGVVQETLLDAAAADPPPDRPVRHWLRTLLRRNYLDAARLARAARRDGRRDGPLGDLDPPAGGPSPSRGLLAAERADALLAGLAALAPDRRAAVRLRYLDGLGVDEVARRLGKSRAAAAGLIRRGLADLRDRLDP